jgi:hypothetical protein
LALRETALVALLEEAFGFALVFVAFATGFDLVLVAMLQNN